MALLTFDLEMPKVEHKIKLELGGVGDYHSMQLYEDKVISDMVKNVRTKCLLFYYLIGFRI